MQMPYISVGKCTDFVQKARNFSREDMEAGVKFAHENGVKVYVTANIVAHNEDLEGIREYFRELKEIGQMPDYSDPGVFIDC